MRKLKYKEAKPGMKVFAKTLKGKFIPHKIKYISDHGGYEHLSVQKLFKSGKAQKKIATGNSGKFGDFYIDL